MAELERMMAQDRQWWSDDESDAAVMAGRPDCPDYSNVCVPTWNAERHDAACELHWSEKHPTETTDDYYDRIEEAREAEQMDQWRD